MSNTKRFTYMPAVVVGGIVAAAVLSNGCSVVAAAEGAAQGCSEFSSGNVASLQSSVDGKTFAFIQAAASLQSISNSMEAAVTASCIGIATDLGVMDTWSAMSGADAILTEACNQANMAIQAAVMTAQTAGATVTLSVSGGECTVDASAQVSCEGSCKVDASCTEPDVSVRCSPGDLSGQCSASCTGTCEGSVSAPVVMCQGSCSADCTGSCMATATAPSVTCSGTCQGMCAGTCDGTAAMGTTCAGTCAGKCTGTCMAMGGVNAHCDGSCTGSCDGSCTASGGSAQIMCSGSCKGGCSVAYTAPTCEGKLTPPKCMGDANCQASCSENAELTATCTPPTVTLEVDGGAAATLVATINKNLPPILLAAKTQGPLAVDAIGTIATTGAAVVGAVTSLGGKALACATVAANATANASASVNVSVMASVSVSGSASGGT